MSRPTFLVASLLALAAVGAIAVPNGQTVPVSIAHRLVPASATLAPGLEPVLDNDLPADKVRKLLDRKVDFLYSRMDLKEVLRDIAEKAKISIVIDERTISREHRMTDTDETGNLLLGLVDFELRDVKLRIGLRAMLNNYDLDYAIVGEQVVVSTRRGVADRVMSQMVTIDVEEKPLAMVLRQLVREHNVNILLDVKAGKQGQTKVSVALEDVPLETVVVILAEQAELKAVRAGSILVVAQADRAMKLQSEIEDATPAPRGRGGPLPPPPIPFVMPGPGFGGLPPVDPSIGTGGDPEQSTTMIDRLRVDKKPLDEILRKLAKEYEFNVVIDQKRAGERCKAPVSIDLRDAPVSAAIRCLAELAELRLATIEGVLYVTTKEHAAELETLHFNRLKKLHELQSGNSNQPQPLPPDASSQVGANHEQLDPSVVPFIGPIAGVAQVLPALRNLARDLAASAASKEPSP
jgi:hypothetical protein